jgi:colanic acid biosynthesis protein WcaH
LYETTDVPEAGGKHYVPVGFVVWTDKTAFEADEQHRDLRTFSATELPDLHENVEAYLLDAGVID